MFLQVLQLQMPSTKCTRIEESAVCAGSAVRNNASQPHSVMRPSSDTTNDQIQLSDTALAIKMDMANLLCDERVADDVRK